MKKLRMFLIPFVFLFYSITFLNASLIYKTPRNIETFGGLVGNLHKNFTNTFLDNYDFIMKSKHEVRKKIEDFFYTYLENKELSIFSLDLNISESEIPHGCKRRYQELFGITVMCDFIKRYNHTHSEPGYVNAVTLSSLKMLFPLKKTNSTIKHQYKVDKHDVNDLYINSYECIFGGDPQGKKDILATYYGLAKINNDDLQDANDDDLAENIETHNCWDKVTNGTFEGCYRVFLPEDLSILNITSGSHSMPNSTANESEKKDDTPQEDDRSRADDVQPVNNNGQGETNGQIKNEENLKKPQNEDLRGKNSSHLKRKNSIKVFFGGVVFFIVFLLFYKYGKK